MIRTLGLVLWLCSLSCLLAWGFFLKPETRAGQTVILEGSMESADLHGEDANLALELAHYFVTNLRKYRACGGLVSSFGVYPLHQLNFPYISRLIKVNMPVGGWGIVSNPRKRATAMLSKLAITLPNGDFVETGSYIGTCAVIMLKILRDFDRCGRKLWVFDSFEGLPIPSREDRTQGQPGQFNVTLDKFTQNLVSQGVYDMQKLVVTKGWFKDTLPASQVSQIAFLRLDGDLFESTWDAVVALYDRVVPGGIIYVDDYGSFVGCANAIEKFRTMKKIYEPLHYVLEKPRDPDFPEIVFEAVWWVKRYD